MDRQTRKLQEVGGGTFTVSVPKEWATEHGLTAGSAIHLYSQVDGSLVVRGSDEEGKLLDGTRIEIDNEDPNLLARTVRAAYATGFESITLTCTDRWTDEQRRTATTIGRTLTGMEIVGVEDTEIELRNVIDSSDVSIQQSVTQLQFITLSMYRSAFDALFQPNSKTTDELSEREEEAKKVFGLITRYFNRSLITFEDLHHLDVRRPELFDYYCVARQLTAIGEQVVSVDTALKQTDITISNELRMEMETITADTADVLEDATAAVLSTPRPTVDQAHEARLRCEELDGTIESLDRKLFERSPTEAYVMTKILTTLSTIVDHGGRIAEIAIQANNRQQ
ncbi:MAG: AbrB/MazE/SpoVT family DNA-binding domain-containing protein [Halobacteriales archaeon]